MRHVKAFTYKPKIKAVREGKCRQTIRPAGKRPTKEGDKILWHGWSDRPYWSKWSWQLEVDVKEVEPCLIKKGGITLVGYYETKIGGGYAPRFYPWDHPKIDKLAKLDYIYPPTGIAMGKLFNTMNKLTDKGEHFQIIRW